MFFQQYSFEDLELDNIGTWPKPVRLFVVTIAIFSFLWMSWYFYFSHQWNNFSKLTEERQLQQKTLEDSQNKITNLVFYKEQIVELKRNLKYLTQLLPSKSEEAYVLEDISQAALSCGLKIVAIKPLPEECKGFFLEYPMELILSGTYHAFGEFMTIVSGLPRFITFHDFCLEFEKNKKHSLRNSAFLELKILTKIYSLRKDK